MSKYIVNEWSWVAFVPEIVEDVTKVTVAQIEAAVVLTPLCVSLNASAQGNTVPTPDISSLFETSIPGTSQASFSADFYRDDVKADDIAWATLARGTKGTFFICRYGVPRGEKPALGQDIEVWPVIVTARTAANMASNTAQTFTSTCSVPKVPGEDAVVVA